MRDNRAQLELVTALELFTLDARARVSRERLRRQPCHYKRRSRRRNKAARGEAWRAPPQSRSGRMNASRRSSDVVIWRKDDRTRSCPSRGGPPAGRAFVGTPQPIPAKTDQPNEPLHNPAQPAQLHWLDRPGGRNSPFSDPRRRERAATGARSRPTADQQHPRLVPSEELLLRTSVLRARKR
jgi:hypothetical protein